ncbi:hypothetical protein H6G00_15100 [Leptolyngbya sp. FACHB-541]|uniref:hypothetical protein n=1 Tax=Leptolyngbya sp. FACHB-541 TaxID=2692810 RepID=UPI0016892E58|nr:hypothetical protein [Leptolyngbya sp. FACHB-541]MBD1997937.1 hypothetical protein [Leptolyngbya sp. FACHB-541]
MATLIDEIVIKLHHLPESGLRKVLGFVNALSQSNQSPKITDTSKEPLLQTAGMLSEESLDTKPSVRIHDAFLSGYSPEDEGLYDDYPAR